MQESNNGLPAGDGVASQLWKANEALAFESLHSPFVTALGNGSLPKSTFRHYVGQDAFFLQYFARAYALALTKCEATQFDQVATLLKGVHQELKLHSAYAASWGVDLATVQPSPATTAYTDFLMDVAQDHSTGLAEVLCAMAPCSRLYGFLGCTLAKAYPGVSHDYAAWIQTYSGSEYLRIPALKERLLDETAVGRDQVRLQRLYTRAMQLEVDFFQAQPQLPPTRTIRSLVVDFDDTCTEQDTVAVFFEATARAAARAGGASAVEVVKTTSKQLSANYFTKYTAFMERLKPTDGAGASTTTGYDVQGLSQFLDELSDFDQSMMQPVVDSGVLKGVTFPDLLAASEQVKLRAGCRQVLQRAQSAGLPLHVLSVNWSTKMIDKVLALQPPLTPGLPHGLSRDQDRPSVTSHLVANSLQPSVPSQSPSAADMPNLLISNEFEMQQGEAGELVCTGRIDSALSTARDKAWAYQALRQSLAHRQGLDVYVGDSPTDLPALLQADVGVVVGSSSSLRKVCQRFGVTLQPLASAPVSDRARPGVLYEAASWAEIEAFLFGPEDYQSQPYRQQMESVKATWQGQPAPTEDGLPTAATATSNGLSANSDSRVPPVPVVLTVAGSDSGGGAGIQADLKAMQACGVFGTSALAALTAQNTHGVQAVHVTPPDMLAAQINSVLSDLGAGAVKTGMLPTVESVKTVADKVLQYHVHKLVVDPVMVSTSGHHLVGNEVADALAQHLLPLALLVTPNIPEASVLLGGREIVDEASMCQAARDLHAKLGCGAVLVKGGHLVGSGATQPRVGTTAAPLPADAFVHEGTRDGPQGGSIVSDVLFDGQTLHVLRSPTVPCKNTHGTGCTLASAIASYLARGLPVLPAVIKGREYLYECLRHSTLLHIGTGVQQPFNHGWQIADWQRVQGVQGPAVSGPLGQGYVGRWSPSEVRKAMTLYAVTSSECNEKHQRTTEEAVAAAVAGGATIIQIREKECDGQTFLRRAAAALQVCRAAGVPLVINDRIDIALALGPDVGVHIGQSDIPVAVARALLGPGRMLGVSCKTPEQARAAVAAGADYLGVGAVYATTTKVKTQVIGLEGLASVAAAAHPVPIVAIGGLKEHHIPGVMASGAAGVAVVTAIFDAEDIKAATQVLLKQVQQAQQQALQRP